MFRILTRILRITRKLPGDVAANPTRGRRDAHTADVFAGTARAKEATKPGGLVRKRSIP